MVSQLAYGIYKETSKPFAQALEAMRAALKARGFGILWEIDVRATMKAKLNVDFTDYVILGACNPPVAHKALTAEPDIGLLLPCNCIVRREGDRTVLGVIETHALLGLTGRSDLTPLADQIGEILAKALDEAAG